ncbi:MAG: sulfatase-like hydrolase/transferase [Firmicutes bacterium]|nr:sulfatase-like hydrolase/transferase [Bacillota bacterium]
MRKKSNLVFIFTDEQAADTLKAYGNDVIHTPNLDRLADQSIVFERAYVTQPVCTPSRSTLLTGLYPHTNGCIENNVKLPDEVKCFPELGDFSEYQNAYYGKWHLGNEIFKQHGFEEWKSIEDFYLKYYDDDKDKDKIQRSTYHHHLVELGYEPDEVLADGSKGFSRPFCARLPEEHTKAAYLADESVGFIQNNKENPFILFVNFLEPHMPFFGPRDGQYDVAEIPLPANFHHELNEKNPLKLRLLKQALLERGHSGLPLKTEEDWKKMISNYWGLVSLVDAQVGKILDALEENNLMDDTIIVFTSDHGDMMGSHRLIAKCTMFEEAVRVPLLMKIPDTECAGKRVSNPVSQVDIVPTLLELMGQKVPEHLQGQSWGPFLKDGKLLDEENVFIEWNGHNNGMMNNGILQSWLRKYDEDEVKDAIGDPIRTVITPDLWKFNWSVRGEDELYNLKADPYEQNNLAYEECHSDLMQSLKEKIKQWKVKTNDFDNA